MNIGIDIDGVLTDLERMTIDCGTKICVEENIPIKIKTDEYLVEERYNWNEEQGEKFWNTYLVPYVEKSSPREFATEVIKKLKDEGNKIYLITARNESGMPKEHYGQMQELTRKWLKENNIEYDKLIFTTDEDKLAKCIENNITIMIEDSPINIKNIATKIKVIRFDCDYNRNTNGNNILTAYSWYHIYEIIKNI